MKTYSINNLEKEYIRNDFNKYYKKLLAEYKKSPKQYRFKNEFEADIQFRILSTEFAVFNQIKRDGLVKIEKHVDSFYSFEDHAGDCYDPIVNSNIDPIELKRQEKNERKRASNQGFFFHSLFVEDEEVSMIGGFIGNDFYGSGYDNDFYRIAIDKIKQNHEHYYNQILQAFKNG